MLDIKFLREHADVVREDLRKRRDEEKLAWVDKVLQLDTEWRQAKGTADQLRSERNKLSMQVNETKKAGGDIAPILEAVKRIPGRIAEQEERMATLETEIRTILMRMPNVMHESVPYGKDDSENTVVAHFGHKPAFDFAPKNHTELIEALNIVELERAAKTSGARFYFLQGDLAMLDFALQQYAMAFMAKKGYTPVIPPNMMRRSAYEGVTSLADFEDVIYKIQDEDLYLIATSEHPLTAMFQDEVIDAQSLPIKMVGISPCYRKEAGSHGKEEKGIWRVHQFTKIEQIIICKPEESWDYHEEIITNAINLFTSLGLHFRQVLICTGDLGIVAAKKYDLEAWIPSVGAYKEIVSGSNCTAYQAVRLNMKYRENNENKWVHTLNSTCVATSRALVAIIEQNQQADGSIRIPEPLRPYMGGKERITPLKKIGTC
jgi:seryl-tRNA synthetase